MPIIAIENELHWHELRARHIGASEIGALFTDGHPFTTRHAIWARLKGLLPGIEVHPLMERGHEMEPLIARNIERTFGVQMMKANEYHSHPAYPWLGCTLDYYCLTHPDGEGPAGVQIKNVVHGTGKWSPVRCPDYVEFQVQQEMLVTNAARVAAGFTPFRRWFIGFERGGNPEDLHMVERRPIPGITEAIIERSRDLMAMVNHGEPPIDNPLDAAHILAMFKQAEVIEGETLDLTDISQDVERVIAAWQAAKIEKKRAEDREKIAKAGLLRHCLVIDEGDVEGYMLANTVNMQIYIRRTVDAKLLLDVRER